MCEGVCVCLCMCVYACVCHTGMLSQAPIFRSTKYCPSTNSSIPTVNNSNNTVTAINGAVNMIS